MKLYDWHPAPNPRRVRIFLAEKRIEVEIIEVGDPDVLALQTEYRKSYGFGMVPMLELDDGTRLGEAMAICRYLEALHPAPPLMGIDAMDAATVEMWERRAYEEGMLGARDVFRNWHPLFKDRGMVVTTEPIPQIPDLIQRGRLQLDRFFSVINHQLELGPYIAGNRFTVADITTLCAIDFAKMANVEIPDQCDSLRRWYAEVSSRPSASA